MKNIGCLLFIFLFGLPFFLVGLLAAYNEYSFFKNATASSEGIVSNVISVVGKKGTTYKCVYSYTTKTGEKYVCEDAKSTKPALYGIGDKVILYYNPSEPEKAAPNSFMGTWFLPLAFTFVGLCVILGGIWLIKFFGK